MLRDLRNCFRGRTKGFELFLMCPMGDPFRDEPDKLGRDRGGAKVGTPRRDAGLSWTGESAKISESDNDEDVAGLFE